jgi:hypothetical protein
MAKKTGSITTYNKNGKTGQNKVSALIWDINLVTECMLHIALCKPD